MRNIKWVQYLCVNCKILLSTFRYYYFFVNNVSEHCKNKSETGMIQQKNPNPLPLPPPNQANKKYPCQGLKLSSDVDVLSRSMLDAEWRCCAGEAAACCSGSNAAAAGLVQVTA